MIKKILLVGLVSGLLVGCENFETPQETATRDNSNAIRSLVLNDKLPKIERSLERENLKRRIEFINQPDRIGYLYLLSESGQLVKEVQVKGKVSSLNSYLTPMQEVDYYSTGPVVLDSADLDGTWGENDSGIFWFTPDGIYQEWTGLYLYSSERMSFESKPILMEVANEE